MEGNLVRIVIICLTTEAAFQVSSSLHCCTEKQCSCSRIPNLGWRANCAGLHLTTSPYFNKSVVWIDLSQNDLQNFPEREKLPNGLRKLNASNNPLLKIKHDSFANLTLLEELSIANSHSAIDSQILSPGIFKDLKSLKYLNMKNSNTNKGHYPSAALSETVNIETLLLNGKATGFPEPFMKLKKLQNLDVSGHNGFCNISILQSHFFRYLPGITKLDISNCSLHNIHRHVFDDLRLLKELDLSYNDELSFRILKNVTSDLTSINIKILKVNKIHCTYGLGTEVYADDVINLKNTSLQEFHLDSNRIELVEAKALEYLPHTLHFLSAADNKFTMGKYAIQVAVMQNLKILDISRQCISHVPTLENLQCNDLPRNSITLCSSISPTETDLKSDKTCLSNQLFDHRFTFNNSYSGSSSKQSLHSPLTQFPFPMNLVTGYFNMTSLRFSVPYLKLFDNNLKQVYLQDNVLYEWIGPIENVDSLELMDLSNNFCSYVSTFFFDYLTGLKYLKINDNILGFSIAKDKRGDIFKNLRNLRRLEMASNKVQYMPELIFRNLYSLEFLNLSRNLMRTFDVNMNHLSKLSVIDLSHNELQELSSKTTSQFDQLKDLTIHLSENPLRCACQNLEFVRWIVRNKHRVKFGKNDTCQTKSGSQPLTSLNTYIVSLERECTSYTGLIILVTCLIVITITVTLSGIVYRYRWKLRYLYYITKGRYRGYNKVKTDDSDDVYDYDAFVSYAEEDRQFGVHDMVANVEEKGDFRLCFHSRDFIPGLDIAENITNAIHNSRRTVCILSRNYIKSHWCMYELNMARMESIYSREGNDVLFLVLYEGIEASSMPLVLMDIIDRKSYIEFPNDTQGNVVFWDKMRETIAMRN